MRAVASARGVLTSDVSKLAGLKTANANTSFQGCSTSTCHNLLREEKFSQVLTNALADKVQTNQ